jgi:hypothetical protein
VDHFHLKEDVVYAAEGDEDETSCMELPAPQESVSSEATLSRTPLMDNMTDIAHRLSEAANFDSINGAFLKPLFHRSDIHDGMDEGLRGDVELSDMRAP